jgi:hypothetical protein
VATDNYWDDDTADLQSDAEAELIEAGIRERSDDNVRSYLGTYGDAVEARIRKCLNDAETLAKAGHFGPALVLAATSVELILGHLVLRPLLQGAFLSEEWADILARRITGGRSADDRELLPRVARLWKVDVSGMKLQDGRPLWNTVVGEIWPTRNHFVHRADPVNKAMASSAIEAVRALLNQLVAPIAMKVGLSWPHSGAWAKVEQGIGGATFSRNFEPADPFG